MKFENSLQEESQAVKIRLKVGNEDFSEVIDKFGDKVDILPIDDYYFIATICEEISPELYIMDTNFAWHIHRNLVTPQHRGDNTKIFFRTSQGILYAVIFCVLFGYVKEYLNLFAVINRFSQYVRIRRFPLFIPGTA